MTLPPIAASTSNEWTDPKAIIPIIVSAASLCVSFVSLAWSIMTGIRAGVNRERDRNVREFDAEVRAPINAVLAEIDALRNEIKALGHSTNASAAAEEFKAAQDKYTILHDRLATAVSAGDAFPRHNGLLKLKEILSDENDAVFDAFNIGFRASSLINVTMSITAISGALEILRTRVRNRLAERANEIFQG